MQLLPAIDLLDGRCVRLLQGDFDRVTYYQRSPEQLANDYFGSNIEWLHVVDLAASRDGEHADSTALFELLSSASQLVQTGGGVRNEKDVQARLDAGAERVVVGSMAAQEPDRFRGWLEQFGPDALVAALDVQFDLTGTPLVRTNGWKKSSGKRLWDLLDVYSDTPLVHILCTDISKDGLLCGPNFSLYREICKRYPGFQVQASGGIRNIPDLVALATTGATAAISGKALLDGLFTAEDALVELERKQ